jgi:hypothetical protein
MLEGTFDRTSRATGIGSVPVNFGRRRAIIASTPKGTLGLEPSPLREATNRWIQSGKPPIINIDFSQLERKMLHADLQFTTTGRVTIMPDMNTHLATVTGMERGDIKALRFSEVYGMQRADFVEEYGERGVQMMTMQFLQKYPVVAGYARLKKSRARMMVEAMKAESFKVNGSWVENGNIKVYLTTTGKYLFYYRGTVIMTWNPFATSEDSELHTVDAGEFEHTHSTIYQRRMVKQAVEEFKKVVLCL